MNILWGALILAAIACSIVTKTTTQISSGVMSGAKDGISLVITLLPMLMLWSGLMEIARKSGMTTALAKCFSPLLKRLFPTESSDPEAFEYISLNISSNLLGLGNAATPFGISAMKRLKKHNPDGDSATRSMVLFVVLNTASIQLLPTTVGMIRFENGSASPFDILPCVWITSVTALAVGVTTAYVLMPFFFKKKG